MAALSEHFLSEDGFEAVLATFYCYPNASEEVEKIATDKKEIENPPWMLQFAAKPKHIISDTKKGWLLGHLGRS